MQLWLLAGFIGPLVGFILGIALTYAILKRFASVRNFIFDSLVRACDERLRVDYRHQAGPLIPLL